MPSTPLSIGIIGTGFGKMIGLNFKAVAPDVALYFAGRDQQKTRAAAKEVGAAGTFATWQELVQDPRLDLIVIASHSSAHKEMFLEAARTGKSILVEKPAALHAEEVLNMSKAFGGQLNDSFAVVNHEGRFHPVVSYLKDLIDSHKLGDILTLRVGAYLNWYSDPEYQFNWNNQIEMGGGQIFSMGTHQLDLANYLLGFPGISSGAVQDIIYPDPKFKERPTSDSQFAAHFATEPTKAGACTSIQVFNDCYCFGYKDFTIEVLGSKGIALYSDQRGLKASFGNSEPLRDVVVADPMPEITLGRSILSRSMKYMAKVLVEMVETGKRDPRLCTLEQERKVLELFEKY